MRFRLQVPRNEPAHSCLRRKETSGLFVCLLRNLSPCIACTLLNASIFHIEFGSKSKGVLLHMAQSWVILAEQAEKNSETTLVYETPEPRRHAAQERQQRQPDNPKMKE
jgi:hypothetical protein